MRLAIALPIVLCASCAGDFVNHRFDLPVSLGAQEHDELLGILGLTQGASSTPASRDWHVVSGAGVGPLRLGMTLDEARKALPSATFKRATDGDGAALVEVRFAPAPTTAVLVWADEDDPGAPIDWSKKIVTIETFSPAFHTAAGIHPGSSITEAEKAYGKTKAIKKSEIESREYITFARQPAYLTFRLAEGKIHSIAVSSSADAR